MTARPRVVVVGAGAAGLSAARQLGDRYEVVVFDKARGVGGRMATRRLGDATFDHGAQFLTAHDPGYARTVEEWSAAGAVVPWFHGQVGPSGVRDRDGHVRFRGAVSMNAVAKHLAVGLDVRRSTRVRAVSGVGERWQVHLDDDAEVTADAVVLTAPVPQSLEVLAAGATDLTESDVRALGAIVYDPCLAVMATMDGPSGLPEPGAVAPDGGAIDWLADNHLKGISDGHGVTVHASAGFSSAHWRDADVEVVEQVMAAARVATGLALPLGEAWSVQRWRYARPTVLHPRPCLVVEGPRPLVLAGDAFGDAKVEGAVRSGAAAASAVRELLALR